MSDENYNIIVSYCDPIELENKKLENINKEENNNDNNDSPKKLCFPKLLKKSSKEIILTNQCKTTSLNGEKNGNKFSFSKKYSKSHNGDIQLNSHSKIKFNKNLEDHKIENVMFNAYKNTENFEEFYKELTDNKFIIDD
jgi:hypothetical protein